VRVALIAAVARNGVIGAENRLPWKLPEDLRRFRELTTGKPVIMGRKTWESIGRPLPGRRNLVITRRRDFVAAGAECFGSLSEALAVCEGECFVIGGGEIYAQAMPLADRLYLTRLERDVEGDAYFPPVPEGAFREVAREERVEPERFAFLIYERVN
jgi:dihydrofolate reductase